MLDTLGHRLEVGAGDRDLLVAVDQSQLDAGSSAVLSTPAAFAVRFTGTPWGPSPVRTAKTETLRMNGTVFPAAATTATDDASSAERKMVRRLAPTVNGS